MKDFDMEAFAKAVGRLIHEKVTPLDDRLDALVQRVGELERRIRLLTLGQQAEEDRE